MKEKIKLPPVFSGTAEKPLLRSKAGVKTVLLSLIYFAAAYFLGEAELVFETFPLGLSFVCAVTENVPAAAAGAFAAAVLSGENAIVHISGIVVAVGFRYALSYALHKENIGFPALHDGVPARIASVVAGGFTLSLIRIIYGGFRYYDLLAAVFFLLCSSGAVYAYSACFDRENEYTQKYEAGVAAVMFSAVTVCGRTSFLGISLSVFTAFFLTLFTGRKGGAMRGAVIGFLCGAAADLTLCPMFGITGFICGLFSAVSAYAGVIFALIAGVFGQMYISGIGSAAGNLPEAALSAFVFLPLDYFGVIGKIRLFGEEVKAAVSADARRFSYQSGLETVSLDIRRLSDAMRSVSELTSDLSDAERTADADELARLCERTYAEICENCGKKSSCSVFGTEMRRELFLRTGAALYEKKSVTENDMPKILRDFCGSVSDAVVKININNARLTADRTKNDRTSVIAKDTEIFADLLKNIYSSDAQRTGENEKSTALIRSAPFANMFSGGPVVCGERKKYITGVCADSVKLRKCAKDIKKSFEAALSEKLTDPETVTDGKTAVFRTESRPVYTCEAAKAERTKENEIINGDTAFYLRGREDYFYGAVCDGMGSGRDAALSSKLSGVVTEKLLHAGCGADDTLEVLNHIIKQKRTECFSTLDMIRIDLLNGQAVFYKCGAAPSVVLRNGRIYKLASHTPPVGIMNGLYAEKIRLDLQPDDVAIVMSDGVADAAEDPSWITEALSDIEDTSPENVAETLVMTAEEKFGVKDDMSVLAIKIRKI